jgi:hypothetical protein
MQPKDKTYAQEYHYFLINTPPVQQSLKSFFQNSLFIGKYDYPHFNKNAPMGTSLFPLANER